MLKSKGGIKIKFLILLNTRTGGITGKYDMMLKKALIFPANFINNIKKIVNTCHTYPVCPPWQVFKTDIPQRYLIK